MTTPLPDASFSDIILAALNTSTVINGRCVMLHATYTDDTRRDITVTAERYELAEGDDGALAVSTIEQMQLFPTPVAPVVTVTPAHPVAPVPDPDPTVTWMPAVGARDTADAS